MREMRSPKCASIPVLDSSEAGKRPRGAKVVLTRARRGLLLAGLVLLSACRSGSRREVWMIPEGYVGWLRLDYGVEGALPLPIEKGYYVVRFTRTGRLQTSSRNRSEERRVGKE